jgi:hypothetical protein
MAIILSIVASLAVESAALLPLKTAATTITMINNDHKDSIWQQLRQRQAQVRGGAIAPGAKRHSFLNAEKKESFFRKQPKEEDTNEESKRKALAAVQKCYRFIFLSAIVDVFTLQKTIESGVGQRRILFEALSFLWKIALAYGLRASASFSAVLARGDDASSNDISSIVDHLYRTMARLWRRAAWMITLTSLVDLLPIVGHVRWLPPAFIALVVSAVFWVRTQSAREFSALAGRISNDKEVDKLKIRMTVGSMAACTVALLIRGCLVIPLVIASKATWRERLASLPALPTPLATAGLLWQLRAALLSVMTLALEVGTVPEDGRSRLFRAQAGFYSKVASTFASEGIGKVAGAVLVPFFHKIFKA